MIEELTLRGFKSYPAARTETVAFTRGVNKIAGRNAAGKTTLLEAVLFGLVPGSFFHRDILPEKARGKQKRAGP